MTPPARIAAAIDLLQAVDATTHRPADGVANDFFRARRFIGSGDRRAVSDRAWRVLRLHRRLAWWLDRVGLSYSPRLAIAASLLLEGWTLSGIRQSFAGGKFSPPPLGRAEEAGLARLEGHTPVHPDMPEPVRLELPDWIVPRLQSRFGVALGAEMEAAGLPAALDLRVNLLKGTREQAIAALAAEGIEAAPTKLSPWGLRVAGRRSVTTGAAFRQGLIEIQDEGSQLVAALVGAKPGMRVADWCAGAGGKTLALAMTMENRGHIVACDTSPRRLDAAVVRLRRAGVHNAERHLLEIGGRWAKRHAAQFDRVLVDAPCTGTGTWRRNPDAPLRLTETDLAELLPKQAAILDAAARLVRPGGRLIYATCSLLAEENEAQVTDFRVRHSDFSPVSLARAWSLPTMIPGHGDALLLTPRQHGTDGFFAAVLERGQS